MTKTLSIFGRAGLAAIGAASMLGAAPQFAHAQAYGYGDRYVTRCDSDGDRCATFRCDGGADACDRVSAWHARYGYSSRRYGYGYSRYGYGYSRNETRCDSDGDRCATFRCDGDGDSCRRITAWRFRY